MNFGRFCPFTCLSIYVTTLAGTVLNQIENNLTHIKITLVKKEGADVSHAPSEEVGGATGRMWCGGSIVAVVVAVDDMHNSLYVRVSHAWLWVLF